MKGEVLRLEIIDGFLTGELALDVPPGTTGKARDQALDALLSKPLGDLAAEHGVALAAAYSAFAFPEPGKDDQRRTRFTVRGRVEGDRLVPQRRVKV